jgi:hypothetical protein
MKPEKLSTPDRDVGRPSIQPLMRALIDRVESIERRLAQQNGAPAASLQAERSLLSRLDIRPGDGITLEQKRILSRALDEVYFRRELAAGLLVYEGGAADAVNLNAVVARMPHGAAAPANNSFAHRKVAYRDLWARTRPRLNLWYTSPVGSTAAFDLRFQVRMYAPGGTTAPATLFSVQLTPVGPAVANTVLFTTIVGTALVPSLPAPLRLTLVRLGGDANANDLDIVLGAVVFEEVA